jgi:DNA repair protein RecO (recombination protein O)
LLVHTQGIVLSTLRYRETSLIVRTYTQSAGLQSFIVNGVRKSKPSFHNAFFQPLSLLELVVYQKPGNSTLHRLKEVHTAIPYKHIGTDQVKTCAAFFLAELLEKAIREEEGNTDMFQLLWNSCQVLDLQSETNFVFLHQFMVRLASALGFGVENIAAFYTEICKAANSTLTEWEHQILPEEVVLLETIIDLPIGTGCESTLKARRMLLHHLIFWYRIHLQNFTELKTLSILQEVMS